MMRQISSASAPMAWAAGRGALPEFPNLSSDGDEDSDDSFDLFGDDEDEEVRARV